MIPVETCRHRVRQRHIECQDFQQHEEAIKMSPLGAIFPGILQGSLKPAPKNAEELHLGSWPAMIFLHLMVIYGCCNIKRLSTSSTIEMWWSPLGYGFRLNHQPVTIFWFSHLGFSPTSIVNHHSPSQISLCLINLIGGFKHGFYVPFHIWYVILPIDELHSCFKMAKLHQPVMILTIHWIHWIS